MKKAIAYFPEIIFRHLRIWTLKELSVLQKVIFMFQIPISWFRLFFLRKKSVNYFGHQLAFERFVDPITLLTYPQEVSTILAQLKDVGNIHTVLDIGGNIGQFSITMVNMAKVSSIDVFEPNSEIYKLLERNTRNYPHIKLFNFGIGKKGSRTFYFEENKSSTGSIVKSNANNDQTALKEIKINLVDNVYKITKRRQYDLIKIDVEGSEYEVIAHLKGVKTKYLYMEISANREKSFYSSEIFELITRNFGKFEVLWQDEVDNEAICYNILLYFLSI